jgi:hypothetical protein
MSRTGTRTMIQDLYSKSWRILVCYRDLSIRNAAHFSQIRCSFKASRSSTDSESTAMRKYQFGPSVQRYRSVANRVRIKDDTVPYPSAAIDTVDHFTEWTDRGIEVEADDDGIMLNWERGKTQQVVKKGWTRSLGTLPPVLRFRFPYNYVSFIRLLVLLSLRAS